MTRTGTVAFGEYRTWFRVEGDLASGVPPVVLLLGGPGATHDYLLAMTGLATGGRAVVLYDQLGNGGSTHLRDKAGDGEFWTMQLFLESWRTCSRSWASPSTTSSARAGAGSWPRSTR